MGKHIHKLADKNFKTLTAVCAVDGPVQIVVYGNTYRCAVAHAAARAAMRSDRAGSQEIKRSDTCARCGFVCVDLVQMDRDHINGDRTDHRFANIQTLCANCHRLKSYRPALYSAWRQKIVGVLPS